MVKACRARGPGPEAPLELREGVWTLSWKLKGPWQTGGRRAMSQCWQFRGGVGGGGEDSLEASAE